jgi:hypothetical protein
MSRIPPHKLLIMNIERKIQEGRREYMPPDKALELLKSSTGQDFGDDVEAWKKWLKDNKKH